MFEWLHSTILPIIDSIQVNSSVFFAVVVLFSCILLLAFRELASWFFKTNHLKSEVLGLRDDMDSLIAKMDALQKSLDDSRKLPKITTNDEDTSPSVIHHSPLKKLKSDQFPLQ